ncbi:penicillin acylase family protein [Janthinobacterium sp. BJB426]|uniref:penicillin acylase family protein n=1 Tax=Janthinobacterium sp. BJB426 TaxID=2048010 RepID=UPI000C101D78|nr:penicillin acylase family protein [Janthinobacterium sp. BJB426]PHV24669.1 penicillin acylase family protein [Janthinobacterium sp. BJB426]
MRGQQWMRRPFVWALLVLAMLTLALLTIFLGVRGSLPLLDGRVHAAGVTADVQITRDADGVPTVSAGDRNDGAYAMGFLHAQERFFQMDLLRRAAAGELSALLGADALADDKDRRRFRFRARAQAAVKELEPAERLMLSRYVLGVNEGLARLTVRPFEYLALREAPKAWLAEDSLLVMWAMYLVLQSSQEPREFARGWIKDNTTADQLALLMNENSHFEATLDMVPADMQLPTIPKSAPAWLGRRGSGEGTAHVPAVGSNSWAVAGTRTADGRAILANDMHLDLGLPNTWYRVAMHYPVDGKMRRVIGLTLPGVPLFAVGSNGLVAWGMTNSYGDYLDLVEVHSDPADKRRFKIGATWHSAIAHEEFIEIKGEDAIRLTVLETPLGPVRELAGRHYAVHWIASDPRAVNLRLFHLESAKNVGEATAFAAKAGMPSQNITVVDSVGQIGWSIAGPLPKRLAVNSATYPYTDNDGYGWTQLLHSAEYPTVINPANGILWNANNRQLAGPDYAKLGDGGTDFGARAQRIRDSLITLHRASENDVMAVALDTSAGYMGAWRAQALSALPASVIAGHPARAEFRRLLETAWDNRAEASSVGYRLTRAYYQAIYDELYGYADAQMASLIPGMSFETANRRWGELSLSLLQRRPTGWLAQGRSWESVELAAVDLAILRLSAQGETLANSTWGKRNRLEVRHPLATALPFGSFWLSVPDEAVPGDDDMPRVSGPSFGQSERLVVSPGREEQGLFNMPGGQSGHPLSTYFLAGHKDWLQGKSRSLLPGKTQYQLTLTTQ